MTERLPAHLEIAALIRAAQAAGGFAAVLSRGERDAGTILVLTTERGGASRLWERLPNLDGSRNFTLVREQGSENKQEFDEYIECRCKGDPDAWVLELDVPNGERLIADWTG